MFTRRVIPHMTGGPPAPRSSPPQRAGRAAPQALNIVAGHMQASRQSDGACVEPASYDMACSARNAGGAPYSPCGSPLSVGRLPVRRPLRHKLRNWMHASSLPKAAAAGAVTQQLSL
jgi:hypothetical protein